MNTYNTYSDEQLIELLKSDDQNAFEELYQRHWKLLFNAAFKILNDTEQSKDAVTDVFLYVWTNRSTLNIDNLPGYLKKAARFRSLRSLRTGKEKFFELFDSVENSPYQPDRPLLNKESMELIEAWINVLPTKRREIFIKHFFEGLNTKEIAEQLSISQKTVQNQLGTATNYLYSRFSHLLTLFWMIFVFFFVC